MVIIRSTTSQAGAVLNGHGIASIGGSVCRVTIDGELCCSWGNVNLLRVSSGLNKDTLSSG